MKTSSSRLSRRNFLIGAGAGGVATAVAVATATKSPQGQPKKAGAVSGSKGYHVTEHIRKYYATTKV
jgi:hypothetical protein